VGNDLYVYICYSCEVIIYCAIYSTYSATLEAKKKRTEEDSVSCAMKYSTDVEWRSDSLAVISSRDINQFTYIN
jgi:hypothetical protein